MNDFEQQEIKNAPAMEPKPDTLEKQSDMGIHNATASKLGIVVLAVVFGIVGGLYGSLDLARRPFFQKLFNGNSTTSNLTQSVTLNEESATTDVVKKAGPAVVSVVISKDVSQMQQNLFDPFGFFGQQPNTPSNSTPNIQQVGAGSGFFVSSDGMIMTNKHVVSDAAAKYSVVTNDGKSYEAKVLATDPTNDLAIIKIDIKDAPHLDFADSSQLQLGQHVIAIGNSLGQYQNTVTSGIVSGIGRSITAGGAGEQEQLDGVIQTDAAINAGNSGGPLLDLTGRVVGINTAIDQQGQSIGFALPANDVKTALDSYNKDGKITRPYLGIRYMMITDSVAKAQKLDKDYGALVIGGRTSTDFAVVPSSPADKAGIQENDIILEVNGKQLSEDYSLSRALKQFRPNDQITLKLYRKGQEQTVTVTLGEFK